MSHLSLAHRVSGATGSSRTAVAFAAAGAGLAATLGILLWLLYGLHEDVSVAANQRAVEIKNHEQELTRRSAARAQEIEQHEHEVNRRVAVHNHQIEQLERHWHQHLAARAAAVEEALRGLLQVRLPAALRGAAVPPAPHGSAMGKHAVDDPVAALLDEVVTKATASARQAGEQEESLRLAVVALSRRVQTAAHSIQEQASLLGRKYEHDADVLESSMRVDHAAAQQARHAQSLAVLCGEWPGQQWQQPLAVVDVVRAASARILAYERIEVSGDQDVAVAAEVVEPVIHLVAELLANATQSSAPAINVPVSVRRVQRGAVIEIDDGGICMDEHRLEQAREVVSGRLPVGLGELGEIPQLGLAVVGHYVRRHGLRADLSESPYGGVRAVVLIPADVVTAVEPAGADPMQALSSPQGEGLVTHAAVGAVADSAADPPLPRRRSRRDQAAPAPTQPDGPRPPDPTPQEAGSWMRAFLSASGSDADGAAPADTDDDRG